VPRLAAWADETFFPGGPITERAWRAREKISEVRRFAGVPKSSSCLPESDARVKNISICQSGQNVEHVLKGVKVQVWDLGWIWTER